MLYENLEIALAEKLNILPVDKEKEDNLPIRAQLISEYKSKNKTLMRHLKKLPRYFSLKLQVPKILLFHNKIYVPKPLRNIILR